MKIFVHESKIKFPKNLIIGYDLRKLIYLGVKDCLEIPKLENNLETTNQKTVREHYLAKYDKCV